MKLNISFLFLAIIIFAANAFAANTVASESKGSTHAAKFKRRATHHVMRKVVPLPKKAVTPVSNVNANQGFIRSAASVTRPTPARHHFGRATVTFSENEATQAPKPLPPELRRAIADRSEVSNSVDQRLSEVQ